MARDCLSPLWCFNCKGIGHGSDDCRRPWMCCNCSGNDHFSYQCPIPEYCKYCSGERHFTSDCIFGQLKKLFKQCSECGGMYHHAEDHYSEYPFWGQCCNAGKRKSWSSRPVHSPTAAPVKGQSALKGSSLCPKMGLFGVGPTKQGHTKDGFEVITSIASSTNLRSSDPQDGISFMTADTRHRVFIDSGATNCITPLEDAITDFVPGKIFITLATHGTKSVAKGHGVLILRCHSNSGNVDIRIPGVIVDPSARSTLLSSGILQDLGITSMFFGSSLLCQLVDVISGNEICRGQRFGGGLYEMPIDIIYPKSTAFTARCLSVESYKAMHHALAHLRLGHVNERDLEILVKSGRLTDVTLEDLDEDLFCYGCKVGKATNLPYKQSPREKTTRPGGRVHTDIWGPIRTSGMNRERYMMIFVDEAT